LELFLLDKNIAVFKAIIPKIINENMDVETTYLLPLGIYNDGTK
jgi:hypothetical protein